MKIPMPSPRGTNHARLFINAPVMAMDAAIEQGREPDYHSRLIGALLKFALSLDPDKKAALEHLIENTTDPRATVAKDQPARGNITPESLEKALGFLRTKGISEDDINHVRELEGFANPTQAQDSARRERDEVSFLKRFPDAGRIATDGALDAPRHRAISDDARVSYEKMFPTRLT